MNKGETVPRITRPLQFGTRA